MPADYTKDYLLDKHIKIFQPLDGYRASGDAVMLAAMVENSLKSAKILDVGSGTGAVSLCLAHRLQNNAVQITGVELQEKLCELANLSAKENGFSFVNYVNADIFVQSTAKKLLPCSFDAVVSNPPYSDHDMPSPNQSKAAAHNMQQSGLYAWLEFCLKMTKPFGKIYIINRVEALPTICEFFSHRAGNMVILPIYTKKNEVAKRIIVCVQKDSKAPCKILPAFLVHENGSYTPEAQKILRAGEDFSAIL